MEPKDLDRPEYDWAKVQAYFRDHGVVIDRAVFESSSGRLTEKENMTKFKNQVEEIIGDIYVGSDGERHAVSSMNDEHLKNAALKIIRENPEAMGTGVTDERLARLSLTNQQFRILFKEIKRRDL